MREPWSIEDVERILAAARKMPGNVGSHRAGEWWLALLLVLLEIPIKAYLVLQLDRDAYDHAAGTLTIPQHQRATRTVFEEVHELNPITIEALDAIRRRSPDDGDRLFAWPLDRGGVGTMLIRNLRSLLFRAGIPHVRRNLFERLRATADQAPDMLECIDPRKPVDIRPRAPRLDRGERADHAAKRRETARRQLGSRSVYLIADGSERTLRSFFRAEYQPRRLANASRSTPGGYLASITRLSSFVGSEVSLDQLSDELLERFAAWNTQTRSPATTGSNLRHLRTLWRFAWERRWLDEPPRDKSTPKQDRRIPEAWSLDEMGRILDAAAAVPGFVDRVPAGDFWLAIVSVLYETGLRFGALLALDSEAFDRETGWLTVPAAVQKHRTDQVFRLSNETGELLARLPFGGELFPVPWAFPPRMMRLHYRRILQSAGLPSTPRDLFHKLRRTHATFVADAFDEHEAQRQLGHSSVQLTIRNYIDPRKLSTRVHAADALPKPQRSESLPVGSS